MGSGTITGQSLEIRRLTTQPCLSDTEQLLEFLPLCWLLKQKRLFCFCACCAFCQQDGRQALSYTMEIKTSHYGSDEEDEETV